eukprot:5727901-Pyramimonas_sp.AAC.1
MRVRLRADIPRRQVWERPPQGRMRPYAPDSRVMDEEEGVPRTIGQVRRSRGGLEGSRGGLEGV